MVANRISHRGKLEGVPCNEAVVPQLIFQRLTEQTDVKRNRRTVYVDFSVTSGKNAIVCYNLVMQTSLNSTTPKPLAGKNALVTGAGRGIGQGIAIALAQAGANVVVNDINFPDESIAQCTATGVRALAFEGDVSDRNAMESAVEYTVSQLGSIDILVSNAAFSDRELFYTASDFGFRKTIDICMWGPLYLAKATANAMIAAGNGGSMIFVSSPHAYLAIPGAMAYNMAKAAIDQLARTAAVELAEFGIRCNIIHPGWTDTPGERKFFTEDELATRAAALPFGRLAKPSDIARGVVFLADPASDYITGATISIDGGIVLPYGEMHRVKKN